MNKRESKVITGIAIILMIFLHTCGGNAFGRKSILIDDAIITQMAYFGKICVSIYAFVSGYGLWVKYKTDDSKKYKSIAYNYISLIKKNFKHLLKFFIVYWPIVFMGAIYNTHINKKPFLMVELLKNLLGISWSYNGAWWYVRYYIVMLIIVFPVSAILHDAIRKRFEAFYKYIDISCVVILTCICIIVGTKITGALCLMVFITGELCAEYDLISSIRKNKALCAICFSVGLIIRCLYTNELGTLMLDLLCVPAMVPAILNGCEKMKISGILYKIGIHSTTMWLLHSFIYENLNWIKYFDGIVGFVVIVVASYIVAFIWDGIYKKICNIFSGMIKSKAYVFETKTGGNISDGKRYK